MVKNLSEIADGKKDTALEGKRSSGLCDIHNVEYRMAAIHTKNVDGTEWAYLEGTRKKE